MEFVKRTLPHLLRRSSLSSRRVVTRYFSVMRIGQKDLQPLQPPHILRASTYYCHSRTDEFHGKNESSQNILNESSEEKEDASSSDSTSTTSSSSEEAESSEEHQEEILREKILDSALAYVDVYGWSSDAIAKGSEALGYSSMAHGMFHKGGTDLVNHFYRKCNVDLEKQLKQKVEDNTEKDVKVSTTKFIRDAIELRLRMNEPYLDRWAEALALHGNPTNAKEAIDNLGNLVDHIWYYAGDRSHDFNWYTKRGVLAAIYKGAEISMLRDKSPDLQDTMSSLDRRLDEIKVLAKIVQETEARCKDVKDIGQAAIITGLNILGINTKSMK